MKKTLFGVLALVLVLAMVLAGTVMAEKDASVKNAAAVKKISTPIQMDGMMDDAYKDATPLDIDYYQTNIEGVFTRAVARFVWSEEEKALYCFVLVSDYDTSNAKFEKTQPWVSDSVEMFLDFSNNATQNWGLPSEQITGEGALKRSLQYRIDSMGNPSCYLLEENPSEPYVWDGSKFAHSHSGTPTGIHADGTCNRLINDTVNYFGWGEDATQVDWAARKYTTPYSGYSVEFRVTNSAIVAGAKIGFDFQLNDLFSTGTGGYNQNLVYYHSVRRDNAGASAGAQAQYYDYLTLSSDAAAENTGATVPTADLKDYGFEDAAYAKSTTTTTAPRTTTNKFVLDAHRNTKANVTTTGNNEGDSTTAGENNNGGGGCGSSIAVGSTLAMIGAVGVAGFFTFRKKKNDDR